MLENRNVENLFLCEILAQGDFKENIEYAFDNYYYDKRADCLYMTRDKYCSSSIYVHLVVNDNFSLLVDDDYKFEGVVIENVKELIDKLKNNNK